MKLTIKGKVIKWALKKGILIKGNERNQLLKTGSELGELFDAELKSDLVSAQMELGDIMVCLTIYAYQKGFDLDDCLFLAWNKIEKRRGKTVNGTFIKEE